MARGRRRGTSLSEGKNGERRRKRCHFRAGERPRKGTTCWSKRRSSSARLRSSSTWTRTWPTGLGTRGAPPPPRCGARGGGCCNPLEMSPRELQALTRRFTTEIVMLIGPEKDIPAPDMFTNEQTMSWSMDTYSIQVGYSVPGVVTGKPLVVGGSVGRRAATGRGLVNLVPAPVERPGRVPEKLTAVVQGFGNVGSVAAQELAEKKVKVIGVSDVYGGAHNPDGLAVNDLIRHVEAGGKRTEFPGAHPDAN